MRRLVLAAVLLVALAACSAARAPAHPFGIGTTTGPGLTILSPNCTQLGGTVTATGTIQSLGDTQGPTLALTLVALDIAGGQHTRAVNYPSPQITGTAVPFSLSVTVGQNSAYTCDIEVDWAPGGAAGTET